MRWPQPITIIFHNPRYQDISGFYIYWVVGRSQRCVICDQVQSGDPRQDHKKDKKKLQGMLNHLSGMIAETQMALSMRSRKRFKLSEYFDHVTDDEAVNLTDVRNRVVLQRKDSKKIESDLLAMSKDACLIAVEVKKTRAKTVLPMVLALGGFTGEAMDFCREKGIGTADEISVW